MFEGLYISRYVVTGGAGFIGSTFAKHMLSKGHEVVVFDSFIRKGVEFNAQRLEGAEIVRGDVRHKYDFDKIKGDVDGIYHTAANPGIKWSFEYPEFDFDTNARGTLNVLEFARVVEAPVVYCSTNKVYDGSKINNIPLVTEETRYRFSNFSKYCDGIDENFPVDGNDHSLYGVSKLAGDLLCQEYSKNMGVPTVVNRMSCITGPWSLGVEDQNWAAWFVIAAMLKKPLNIYGDGKQVRDILLGQDLVELVEIEFKKMEYIKGSVFNVGGGLENSMSLIESLDYIGDLVGFSPKIKHCPWRIADQKIYISNIKKVCQATGWSPKSLPEMTLKKIHDWLLENPAILEYYEKQLLRDS